MINRTYPLSEVPDALRYVEEDTPEEELPSPCWTADGEPGRYDEENVIYVHAFQNPEEHPGTMRVTLEKRNAAGKWVAVKAKQAYGGLGWGCFATFKDVAGNKRCKGHAKFTSRNHPDPKEGQPPRSIARWCSDAA